MHSIAPEKAAFLRAVAAGLGLPIRVSGTRDRTLRVGGLVVGNILLLFALYLNPGPLVHTRRVDLAGKDVAACPYCGTEFFLYRK